MSKNPKKFVKMVIFDQKQLFIYFINLQLKSKVGLLNNFGQIILKKHIIEKNS